MLRLVEILLFLSPLAAFLAWRWLYGKPGPPPRVLLAACAALLLAAGVLVWYRLHETASPGGRYVPAQLEGGRIVPGQLQSR
jgi:hypothetical protein